MKQLSFLLCAGCDTLPTPMNLAHWNIITSPVCIRCHCSQPTTNHTLTGCSVALDQGRYTWRHDSLLQVLVRNFKKDLPPCYRFMQIFLAIKQVLVPQVLFHTSTLSRSDLMLVSTDYIVLLEFSLVTNTEHHLLAARYHKGDCYGPLLNNLEQVGFSVNLVTIEVGCLGHFKPETVSKLSDVYMPSTKEYYSLYSSVSSSCCNLLFIQNI